MCAGGGELFSCRCPRRPHLGATLGRHLTALSSLLHIKEKTRNMKTRRTFLCLAGLSLLLGAAPAFAAPPAGISQGEGKAEIGRAAPDFTLTDTEGKEHRLSQYKGQIVILQWINPDCPYCRRVMAEGAEARMIRDLKEIDENIVLLAINSTHYMKPDDTARYLKKHKIDVPGLIDADGTVGRLYGARTTPHVFVIDKKGVLRYGGAIDDDRNGRLGESAQNYVVNAVRQISGGETVAPDSTKPYGCGVKYAKK
jgi:peroxiredoxin